MKGYKFFWLFNLLLVNSIYADFVIKQIKVEGANKIPVGTVLNYVPLEIGDKFKDSDAPLVINSLYRSGFFKDIQLYKQDNVLIVRVKEQSTLSAIRISGNKEFSNKNIREILDALEVKEGRSIDHFSLKRIKVALLEQYKLKGYYAAQVDFDLDEDVQGRQRLWIKIKEQDIAKVKYIGFTGNKVFSDKKLRSVMGLKTTGILSWLYNDDRYSANQVEAECMKIQDYYMDYGYLHARVVNDQARMKNVKKNTWIDLQISELEVQDNVNPPVKVTYDAKKNGVALHFTIFEGKQFYFDDFELRGEFCNKKEQFLKAITIKKGTVFSRKTVVEIRSAILEILGDLGYGMPEVIVSYVENGNRVKVIFEIHPKHRVYLRYINFKGNNRTEDKVLRREMRLQEGSLYSTSKINESVRRLANLRILEDLNFQVYPVENTNNQLDLVYTFKEVSDISLNVQAGVSDQGGFSFIAGASLIDSNVLGSGKSLGVRADYSRSSQSIGFNYYDPYYLKDRIGYGFSINISQSNPHKIDSNLSRYRSRSLEVMNSIDVPISDYTQLGFGVGYEHIAEGMTDHLNPKAKDFLKTYGEYFDFFKVVTDLRYSKLDRGIFPKHGLYSSLTLENYMPAFHKSLYFAKVDGRIGYYQPVYKDLIFKINGELGYGISFVGKENYPFFKNFYAGGMNTIRGFEPGTIAPYEDRKNVIGGNVLTLASASLILPTPWPTVVRPSFYYDVGNVSDNSFHLNDLRMSVGFQLEFRTPIGPLAVSFSKIVRKKSWDETKCFQFNISGGF